MTPFHFIGRLPASKSMLNRLLVVQSYAPQLQIRGSSDCEDVTLMRAALSKVAGGEPLQAGSAGTVLRFLALRLSRIPGRHRIEGTRRLFERPHDELVKILRQLGVQSQLSPNALEIESAGWKMHGDTLLVPSHRSSQFATAVLMNAWELPFDLYVSLGGARVSTGYWRMSAQMAEQLGMRIDYWDSDFRVPKLQRPILSEFTAEIDMSSAFALAAAAAVAGSATFLEFPNTSLQPDAQFVAILERMGVPVKLANSSLRIERAQRLNGVAVNLKSAPDLFPVLAALCALAEGDSELTGAPQLVHKESNRLHHMAQWVRLLGRTVEERDDGIRISGPTPQLKDLTLSLDCDADHRLAFAAAVWKLAGAQVSVLNPEVVNKSFPEFWRILGVQP